MTLNFKLNNKKDFLKNQSFSSLTLEPGRALAIREDVAGHELLQKGAPLALRLARRALRAP